MVHDNVLCVISPGLFETPVYQICFNIVIEIHVYNALLRVVCETITNIGQQPGVFQV